MRPSPCISPFKMWRCTNPECDHIATDEQIEWDLPLKPGWSKPHHLCEQTPAHPGGWPMDSFMAMEA